MKNSKKEPPIWFMIVTALAVYVLAVYVCVRISEARIDRKVKEHLERTETAPDPVRSSFSIGVDSTGRHCYYPETLVGPIPYGLTECDMSYIEAEARRRGFWRGEEKRKPRPANK